eukprot:CAMPEP_0177282440 /NCGR_PEP_ID=MMETSP0367-20130122/71461_1 /TAXON_ID=447022 ORGANISM="Scrippsiella hangoei-like, Strain SHHI-4" /NCGR_SAMPLE_ID=MMETSP0367 /ASSEMBLY_ACC=CAM_ASM_000362 /LENGTH=63 /DNA_ID=CAMNT_0018739361 /DNA_START=9 /DNA_END=196 /DNA_ORIENTATION=-
MEGSSWCSSSSRIMRASLLATCSPVRCQLSNSRRSLELSSERRITSASASSSLVASTPTPAGT